MYLSVYLQTTKDTVMRHVSLFHFDQILVHPILFTFWVWNISNPYNYILLGHKRNKFQSRIKECYVSPNSTDFQSEKTLIMKFRTHSWGICLIMSLLSEGMWSQTYTEEFFEPEVSIFMYYAPCTSQQSISQKVSLHSGGQSITFSLSVSQLINQPAISQSVSCWIHVLQ